jgi:hypothetical protein
MLPERKHIMFKLSKTSKLGTYSWSLQALTTCPASLKDDGTLVDACKGCYATTGFYFMPDAIALRQANQDDWKRDGWVADMVGALKKQSHFRWFDSGDVYALPLAEKIFEVMLATPNVKHWLPTRMAKFAKFADVIRRMQALPNVMVRFSSDSINGVYTKGVHGSVICHDADSVPEGTKLCEAYLNGGKCGDCRDCYDKEIEVIAYPAHGKKMHKVIKLSVTA